MMKPAIPVPAPRKLTLPPRDRAYWCRDTATLPLLYLAWGSRDYSRARIPFTRHDGWVYVLVQSGTPVLNLESTTRPLRSGTLLILGPECAFGWGSGTGRLLVWMWEAPVVEDLASLPTHAFACYNVAPELVKELEWLHLRCRKEVMQVDARSFVALEGCQCLLETALARAMCHSTLRERDAVRFDHAKRWMAEHPDSREPVARLCDYLGLSPATLLRIFRRYGDVSPSYFHHEIRMRAALDQLGKGHSVKETAFALGYRHFNDFSRAFHRHFGCLPHEVKLLVLPAATDRNQRRFIAEGEADRGPEERTA